MSQFQRFASDEEALSPPQPPHTFPCFFNFNCSWKCLIGLIGLLLVCCGVFGGGFHFGKHVESKSASNQFPLTCYTCISRTYNGTPSQLPYEDECKYAPTNFVVCPKNFKCSFGEQIGQNRRLVQRMCYETEDNGCIYKKLPNGIMKTLCFCNKNKCL